MKFWSVGVYDYGLTSEAFWQLTPAQFGSLGKAHDDRQFQEDYRCGLLAHILANANRNPKKKPKPFEWTDFFPHWKALIKKRSILTPEEMLKRWESSVVPKINSRTGAK